MSSLAFLSHQDALPIAASRASWDVVIRIKGMPNSRHLAGVSGAGSVGVEAVRRQEPRISLVRLP